MQNAKQHSKENLYVLLLLFFLRLTNDRVCEQKSRPKKMKKKKKMTREEKTENKDWKNVSIWN